jgi:hypothetical protein
MAQPDIILEVGDDLLSVVGPRVVDHFGVEGEELALEQGRSEGVVCDNEEAISGHVRHLHKFFFASLHAHGDIVLIELLLKMGNVGGLEVAGDYVGWVRGRDESLALHVA